MTTDYTEGAQAPSLLSEALRLAELGIHLIPLRPKQKKPLFNTGRNHSVGSADPGKVQAWWEANPEANIGAPCTLNRWCVVDVDGPEGLNALAELEAEYGELPMTWISKTGREGGAAFHYIYRWPTDEPVPTRQLATGLETRAHGAQIVLPPSIHPSGARYEWVEAPGAYSMATPAKLPEWLHRLLQAPRSPVERQEPPARPTEPIAGESTAKRRLRALAEGVASAPEGERNNRLNHAAYVAGRLAAGGWLSESQAVPILDAAGIAAGLEAGEIVATCVSGFQAGLRDGPDPEHTEAGTPISVKLPERKSAVVEAAEAVIIDSGITFLDLHEVLTGDFADEQWLIEPVIPKGRQTAIYAPGKLGKSLVALDIAAAAASGRSVLGHAPQAPLSVMYLDFEMTPGDLQERLNDLGYAVTDPDFETLRANLHYALLQPFEPFDTARGGKQVEILVEQTHAELVVVDTLIRSVEGDENTSDTIKNFNRFTGQRLKARSVSLLRIDHAGKEAAKGQRGSSAKRDDVDLIWRLVEVGVTMPSKTVKLKLVNDASRMSWVPKEVEITRTVEPILRHTVPPAGISAEASKAWKSLVELGAGPETTTREAGELLRKAGHRVTNKYVIEAMKWIRNGRLLTTESGQNE